MKFVIYCVFLFSCHLIFVRGFDSDELNERTNSDDEEEAVNVQLRLDPRHMGFPLLSPMVQFFDHGHKFVDFPKLGDNNNDTNGDGEESKMFVRKSYQIQTPEMSKHVVIESNKSQDRNCPFCSLFDIFHGPNLDLSKNGNYTDDKGTKVTVQVHKPQGYKGESRDNNEFEQIEKTLENVLHGFENSFSHMFSGSRHKNTNSSRIESNSGNMEIPEARTPTPELTSNKKTDEKIHDLEKRLSQVLGMVENLQNENSRLKKTVSSMINGT